MLTLRKAGWCGMVIVAVAGAFIASTAGPAVAATRDDGESRVSVTGPIHVAAGERTDAVVSADGNVRIDGVVDGDVFVAHGDVVVSSRGRVTGAVTVLRGNIAVQGTVGDGVTATSGRAVIGAHAVVDGDVRSSKRPVVAPGARVSGDISETDFATMFTIAGWIALAVLWLAVTVTLLIVGIVLLLLFPRAARATVSVARGSIGQTILWAAILGIGVPIAAGILMATVIALPLGVGLLLALFVAFPLGYVMTAFVIGRSILRRARDIPAFLLGFAILRVAAIIPGIGLIVGFLASAFGLGALAVAAWRAGRRPTDTPGQSPEPGPEPAPPPLPERV
jgi:cytoskeletal protein CcmA (bactofilin family)